MEDMFRYYLDNDFGILLVSDIYSYAYGVNSQGKKLLLGGWESRLIDDGSEYYIGLCAIKAVIAEYEMLGGKTILTEKIKASFNIRDLSELKYILCYKKLSDRKIVSLSREVLKCAKQGDRISINIIRSAADKLFNMIDIIIRRLNMYDRHYNLCITGNIIKFGPYLIESLCDKMYNIYDNIEIFTYNNFNKKDLYKGKETI